MDIREVGDGFVALDGDRALSIEGDAAAAYRAGGMTRRQMLTRIGAGAAVAGVSYVALPMAAAHASLTNGPLVVTLSPTSGGSGRIVQVTVTNLPTVTGTAITTVFVGATSVAPSNTTVTAGTANFTITIPDNEPLGPISVTVNDNHNNSGQATYTVAAATATLSRTSFPKNGSGGANGTFTVTASSNFASSSALSVSVTGVFTSASIASGPTTTSATGTIQGTTVFRVNYPNGTTGSGSVTISDASGNTVTIPISVV